MECWKAFSAFCQFDRIYNLTNWKIKKFLNLSEELQDDITKKAEILYDGQPEILNQLKRKSSKNFYLKFIWIEIVKTIDKEYPEIDIVGIRGGVRWNIHFTLVQINIL